MQILTLLRRAASAAALILIGSTVPTPTMASDWSGTTFISGVYPNETRLVFMTDYVDRDWSSCDSGRRYALDASNPDYPTQVATLLTAFASGKQIRMHVKTGQNFPTCAPVIDRFWVVD